MRDFPSTVKRPSPEQAAWAVERLATMARNVQPKQGEDGILQVAEIEFTDVDSGISVIETDYALDGDRIILRFWGTDGDPVPTSFGSVLTMVKERLTETNFQFEYVPNVKRNEAVVEPTSAFCAVLSELVMKPSPMAVSWILKKIQAAAKE